jgi:uncharacterized protein YdeI (YjbR/CyaY-like superfamily)
MVMTVAGEHLVQVEITSRHELREWLTANHAITESVWLITWKKADLMRHVPYDAVVEELLCFGWVDSLPRKLDDQRSMLLISPRKAKSNWSKVNRDRVEKLLASGLIHPSGLKLIEVAKARGTWEALDKVESLAVPDDLQGSLSAIPGAAANFDVFPKSAKRGILEWILNAKQPATRAKRIEETARLAGQNIRANQWRQ